MFFFFHPILWRWTFVLRRLELAQVADQLTECIAAKDGFESKLFEMVRARFPPPTLSNQLPPQTQKAKHRNADTPTLLRVTPLPNSFIDDKPLSTLLDAQQEKFVEAGLDLEDLNEASGDRPADDVAPDAERKASIALTTPTIYILVRLHKLNKFDSSSPAALASTWRPNLWTQEMISWFRTLLLQMQIVTRYVLVVETAEMEEPADDAVLMITLLLAATKKNRKGEGNWGIRRGVAEAERRPAFAVVAVGEEGNKTERTQPPPRIATLCC